jgi:ACT domain-containing protein
VFPEAAPVVRVLEPVAEYGLNAIANSGKKNKKKGRRVSGQGGNGTVNGKQKTSKQAFRSNLKR